MISALLLAFLVTLFGSPIYAFPLQDQLEPQFELAESVLAEFPPDKFDYLFIGRSGAAVQIALEEQLAVRSQDAKVQEFPLSGLRARSLSGLWESGFEPRWYDSVLETHIKNYFPSPSSAKRILAIDYISSGQTAARFIELIDHAYEMDWIEREVHFLGIMGPTISKKRVLTQVRINKTSSLFSRFHSFKISQSIARDLSDNAFKDYSRYLSWKFRDFEYEEDLKSYKYLNRKAPKMPRYKHPRLNRSWLIPLEPKNRKELRKIFRQMAESPTCNRHLLGLSPHG